MYGKGEKGLDEVVVVGVKKDLFESYFRGRLNRI